MNRPPRMLLVLGLILATAGCAEVTREADRFDTAVNRGLAAQLDRRADEAAEQYRRALELGTSAVASYNLGLLAHDADDRLTAADRYREALAADPRYGPALYNLGLLAIEGERHEEAVEVYRRYVEVAPGDAAGHWNLAVALEALGREDEAAAEREIAVGLDPSFGG